MRRVHCPARREITTFMDALFALFPLCAILGLISLKIFMQLRIARNSEWTTLARLYPAGLAEEGTPFSMQSGYVGSCYFRGLLFVGVSPAGLYLKSILCPALLLPWKILAGYREVGFWWGDGECQALTPQGAIRLRLGRSVWKAAAPYLQSSQTATAPGNPAAPSGPPAGIAGGMAAAYCTNCGHLLSHTAGARFCGNCGHEVAT